MPIPDIWGIKRGSTFFDDLKIQFGEPLGLKTFRVLARPDTKYENELFDDIARDIQNPNETLEQAKRRLEGGYHDFIEPHIDIIYVKAKTGDEAEEKAKKYWLKHGYVFNKQNILKHYEFYSSISNKTFQGNIMILPHHSREFMDELYRY